MSKTSKTKNCDTSIAILLTDKDRATVILDCQDYLEKNMDRLNNSLYQSLKKDPNTKTNPNKLTTLKDNYSKGWQVH